MKPIDHKQIASEAIHCAAAALTSLSNDIFAMPELAFSEHHAAHAVSRTCTLMGLDARVGIADFDTAVLATAGTGPLNIAFCAEYDALPEIGHACGHNLIAAAAVGAAAGLAAVADDLGVTVTLIGTPAEERGGGKIELIRAGAFDAVHLALMAHPAPAPFDVSAPRTLSVGQFEVGYNGTPAHASVAPHAGVNAADAMTIAQVAIGLLRQQLPPGQQVHGIVTHAGTAPNVIPDKSHGEFFVRGGTVNDVGELYERVTACFQAGAVATGCTMTLEPVGQPYAELVVDAELSALYEANAARHGRQFPEIQLPPMGSTDMGNVSQALPSIHPYFGLDCLPALPHQPEFVAHVNTDAAHQAMIQVACALAETAIDAASEATLRDRLLKRGTG